MTAKIVTFGIPCYNSADYMDRCISSILEGAEFADDIQVVIVDDGSTKDDTPAKADEWASRYPELVSAIHQENGGHGMAVLAALGAAEGTFFKVVDSDDWLDAEALKATLTQLRESEAAGENLDLLVTNYVYEHVEDGTSHAVSYGSVLPQVSLFTWDQIGHFHMSQNLLMHSLCYRTSVLKAKGGVPLPAHTFYVDNIYAFVPLPRCKNLRYLDVDLYRYYIGREDQSVNEKVMAGRIAQQIKITRIMMGAYHLYEDVPSVHLRSYMVNYFVIMMAICSIFARLSEVPGALEMADALWADLKAYDRRLYRRCRRGLVGLATNLPGKLGRATTLALYHGVSKIYKFN